MKLLAFLFFLGFIGSAAESYSQSTTFNLKMKNATVLQIFEYIEENSEFIFLYNEKWIDIGRKANINVKDGTVDIILNQAFKGTNNAYKIYDRQITVFKDENLNSSSLINSHLPVVKSSLSEQQLNEISGKVTDNLGIPLPGVSIIVKGTTIGTVTNHDGEFTLHVPVDAKTLQFSFVGMSTQEIAIEGRTVLNMVLEEDIIGLEEVVAVGYGTVRKKDLTGAIVNVRAEEMVKYQPSNIQELLRSSVPGLKVGYSTSAKNTPDFEIRGNNTIKASASSEILANKPLIVLDGVIFNGDLVEININDIESIDVLKDASAASIYGSRASNGVIVITTKKGKSSKPIININAKFGVITGANRLSTFKAGDEVMTWLTDMNESINNLLQEPWTKYRKFDGVPSEFRDDWLLANGIPGETNPDKITAAWLDALGFESNEKENYLKGRGFDWQDWLFHTGLRQDYDISISGRNENISYYWSLGYLNSESVIINDKFSTIRSKLNLDFKATNFLNIGLNANLSYQDEGQQSISNGLYRTASPYDSPWDNIVFNENIPVIGSFINTYPKEYLKMSGAGSNRSNPYLNPAYTNRKYDQYKIFPTIYAKLYLPLGFTFTSNLTTRIDFTNQLYFEDGNNPNWAHGGWVERRHNKIFEWQNDNILNWNKEFGEHKFDFTGLINAEKGQFWYTLAKASNFSPTQALGYHGIGLGLIPQTGSSDEVITRNALMGRINYGLKNKYNFSVSFRRDGYSRFGSEKKYANFPSFSGAWILTNENFMTIPSSLLSFLKLRVSWGVNGNSSGLNSYAAYATLSDNKYLNYDNGYVIAPYVYIDRMANSTLAWEKNQAWNLGLDYGIINDRIRGALDIYIAKTTDMLLDKKLPIVTGFDILTTNVGSLKNTGFDLSINTVNIEKSSFNWNSTFNVSYYNNEIISLTGEKTEITDDKGNIVLKEVDDIDNGWFIGKNKDIIWDYEINGVYKIGEEEVAAKYGLYPGDFRIVDKNNDGVINSKDKIFQGITKNPWYLTLTNDFKYKGLDFGIILLSKLGYKGGTNSPFNNDETYIKNHNVYNLPYWTPENQINNAARINSIRLGNVTYWQNRSYLRIQNVSVGYKISDNMLHSIKFDGNIRLGFTIENLAVFTKWIEGDPESQREMPRTFSFSLNTTF